MGAPFGASTEGKQRVSTSTTTNTAIVQRYLDNMKKKGRSPSTIYTYGRDLTLLLATLEKRSLLTVTPAELYEYVNLPRVRSTRRATGPEMSDASRKRRVSTLRSLYKYMVDVERLRGDNPAMALEAPTVDNENPHPTEPAVWRTLWASDLCPADRVAFGLAHFAGLRRFEVTLLGANNFSDVPKLQAINFRRKGGKIRKTFPLGSCLDVHIKYGHGQFGQVEDFITALKYLRKARAGDSTVLDWVDTRPSYAWRQAHPTDPAYITPDTFNKRLRRACKRAGLDEEAIRPHDLRHAFCTNMLAMLGEQHVLKVSRLANHRDVRVTMRYLGSKDDPLADLLGDDGEDEGGTGLSFGRF